MNYIVAIDIAKFKHDVYICDDIGHALIEPFTISNNRDGFNLLLETLNDLKSSKEIKIGFEATGHYGTNLKFFLEENGFHYMEINPLFISRSRSASSLRKTKTDKVDTKLISSYLMTVEYKPYSIRFYHIYLLKSLTRMRNSLVKERSLSLVRITNILDKSFPELKPRIGRSFKTFIYLIEHFPSARKISKLKVKHYEEMKSALKITISYQEFQKIVELAKTSVGLSDEILEFELKSSINLYKFLDDQIKEIETKIKDMMSNYNFYFTSIKGVGIISAASIISELGSFSNFSSSGKILAYAGLDVGIYQSGTINNKGRMVKHGSSYLRQTLMNLVRPMCLYNPVISDYYWKKKHIEGKNESVAKSHVARKILSIMFSLEKNQTYFNPSLLK